MSLTVFSIENAKAREKPYTLADGLGLHLLIRNGSKLWRFRYRFAGKANMLSFGSYPEVSLASARDQRDEARKLLAAGTDPSQQRKTEKTAATVASQNTFGVVAAEYLQSLKDKGRAEITIEKNAW